MEHSHIEEILIRHDEEIAALLNGFAVARDETLAALAEKTKEFSETQRAEFLAEFDKRMTKVRAPELVRVELRKELADKIAKVEHENLLLSDSLRALSDTLPSRIKEFTGNPANVAKSNFADIYRGTLTADSVYHRGEIWSYSGGTYMAKKDGKGDLPSRTKNGLNDATWATIAAPGMSGGSRGGVQFAAVATGANSGPITTSGLTMSTARLLGRTTAATGAIQEISVGTGLSLTGGVLALDGTGEVTSITGTAGQVVASSSTGAVTLSLAAALTGITSVTSAAALALNASGNVTINTTNGSTLAATFAGANTTLAGGLAFTSSATNVADFTGLTKAGTSTTAAAILGKSMGLTENLWVGNQVNIATVDGTALNVDVTSGTANPLLQFKVAGTAKGIVGVSGSAGAIITGASSLSFNLRSPTEINMSSDGGTTKGFTMTGAGNATLAGTLTSTGLLTASAGLTVASGQDLKLGNAYVAGVQVPSGYIVIKDSSGTAYKVSCNV